MLTFLNKRNAQMYLVNGNDEYLGHSSLYGLKHTYIKQNLT
jgi:hypothetical protein